SPMPPKGVGFPDPLSGTLKRLHAQYATPFSTAFGSVAAALHGLAVERVALGTPYSEEITLKGKAHLEEHGFEVVSHRRLENVTDIYEETAERAYQLGRAVDVSTAQAVFLSGTGMPTVKILATLEQDLCKPAISANSAYDVACAQTSRRAPPRVRLRPAAG